MRGIWERANALRILVLPLRGKLENNSCLFVAVDNTIPKKQEGYNMMDFFDEKAKEFQELTLQASNLSKKDYEEALGWKEKMKVGGGLLSKQLLQNQTANELFFTSLPEIDPPTVQVIYPSCPTFSPHDLHSHIVSFANEGYQNHSKWLYASLSGLPLSTGAAVLPGPNVIFLYNVFRCHSHWCAKLGAERLGEWMGDEHLHHIHQKHHEESHKENKHKHRHEHDHKHKHDDHKHHHHKHHEESHKAGSIEWESSEKLLQMIRDDARGEWLSIETVREIQEELGGGFQLVTPYEKKMSELKAK